MQGAGPDCPGSGWPGCWSCSPAVRSVRITCRPPTAAPEAYKENAGWKVAQPRDELPRGAWWEIYNDPQLNALEEQVDISNQNIAAAEANFRQALALIRVARAAYFPTVTGGPSWSRFKRSENLGSGNTNLAGRLGNRRTGGGGIGTFPGATLSDYLLNFNAAWELDIWGKVRRSVESSQASAQASAATLEGVRLSAQATLAQSYFQLRALDEQKRLLDDTPRAFQKILDLTKNRYASGVASRNDVALAETQLKNTQAQAIDLGVQRAQLEHAIATLLGKPASVFSIPAAPVTLSIPADTRRGAFGTPGAPPRHRRRRKEHGRGQRPDRRGPGGLLPHHYPERHRRISKPPPRPSGLSGPAASGPWARPRRRPCSTAACGAARPTRPGRPMTLRWPPIARPCSPASRRWKTIWRPCAFWRKRRRCRTRR